MTSQKETHLEDVRSIQVELAQLLEGMDYCLDWKPDANTWSVREVVYHLLDTPPGGVGRVLRGTIAGTLEEYDLWADLSNMTPERQSYDMAQVRHDIDRFFQGLTEAVALAAEEDFERRSVLVHNKSRGTDEPRTVKMLLERGFARHWREHLIQLGGLRESLGI